MGKIECIASDYLKDLAQKMINSGSSIQEVDNRLEKELENYRNLIDEKRNFSAPTNLTEIFNKIEDRVKYKRAERNHPRMEKYYNPFTNTDDFEL